MQRVKAGHRHTNASPLPWPVDLWRSPLAELPELVPNTAVEPMLVPAHKRSLEVSPHKTSRWYLCELGTLCIDHAGTAVPSVHHHTSCKLLIEKALHVSRQMSV